MKRTVRSAAVAACFAAILAPGVVHAGNGGNSEIAKLCQRGGWQDVYHEDGASFRNEGDCVSYGARGGTILTEMPAPSPRSLCESLGGAYGTTTVFPGEQWPVAWSCSLDATMTAEHVSLFEAQCMGLLTYAPNYGVDCY